MLVVGGSGAQRLSVPVLERMPLVQFLELHRWMAVRRLVLGCELGLPSVVLGRQLGLQRLVLGGEPRLPGVRVHHQGRLSPLVVGG